jgi:hypothetical protein
MDRKSLWLQATGPSLLKHHYSDSYGPKTPITTVDHSSYGCADVICPSLLEFIVATSLLTSGHPLLLDRKHNLYLVYKRRHNLLITTFIKFIQRVHASSNIYTYIDQFIHQVQQNLNRHFMFDKS